MRRAAPWPATAGTPCPEPSDLPVGGISKRSHRVRFAGHSAVCLADPDQNDISAERWIRTVLSECLYVEVFASPNKRRLALDRFIGYQNTERSHLGIGGRTPRQRVSELLAACLTNLAEDYSQTEGADRRVAVLLDGEIAHRLLTIPGVGPAIAATLLAEIGDIGRFTDFDPLLAYVGVYPAERSCGTKGPGGIRHGI